MTRRQFYDWQTAGGGGDVLLLVQTLEREEIPWCMIDGLAVNHWAAEPIATADIDVVIATGCVEKAVHALEGAGFRATHFEWSINFQGTSAVSVQISTEAFYGQFPERAVVADVHGILMRVATLNDTLQGKLLAWNDGTRRASKKQKDLLDIMRLVEANPEVSASLPAGLRERLRES